MKQCLDHVDFANENCPDCNLPVDEYGNTEHQFDNCSFISLDGNCIRLTHEQFIELNNTHNAYHSALVSAKERVKIYV